MNLINYYTLENCTKMFNTIENPNWRIFKSIDIDGVCRQNNTQITTPLKLQKFIHQCRNPQKVYVSISEFLNPHSNHGFFANQKVKYKDGTSHYPREGYIYADCIIISSYFFIDIDDDDLKNVQEDGRKIIKKMKSYKDYKLQVLQFSANRGIHLAYTFKNKHIQNPIKRIKYFREEKEKLAKDLLELKLNTIDKVHMNIMTDPFRVFSIPFSAKSKGIVTPLDEKEFMTKDIYSLINYDTSEVSGLANECKVATAEKSATQHYQWDKRPGISFPIIFNFVDNMARGLKNNYITVIKQHKKDFKINKLKELQKEYKLSDFKIYEIGDYVYSYNAKLVQFGRLMKILRKIKSRNLSYFMTRKHIPIQISDSLNEDKTEANKMNYIGTLMSKYGLQDEHSKPHSKLFKLEYEKMIGNELNKREPCRKGLMRVS